MHTKLAVQILCVIFTGFLAHANGMKRAASIVPFVAEGDVAAVQDNLGNARLFYQDTTGGISVYCVTGGPFTTGSEPPACSSQFLTAEQVLAGTPIAATSFNDPGFTELHIFYLSPSRVVSEYIWTANGTQSGPNCTQCLTSSGFTTPRESPILYAMENPTDHSLRVGFVSTGSPGTLSEASKTSTGNWQIASLP